MSLCNRDERLTLGTEDMREKFKTIHREKSPTERTLCIYPTTVTDTTSTAITLEAGASFIPKPYPGNNSS